MDFVHTRGFRSKQPVFAASDGVWDDQSSDVDRYTGIDGYKLRLFIVSVADGLTGL